MVFISAWSHRSVLGLGKPSPFGAGPCPATSVSAEVAIVLSLLLSLYAGMAEILPGLSLATTVTKAKRVAHGVYLD